MSLSINNNVSALSAQSSLRSADNQLSQVANQLSSGNRITSPSIDASGLAIGTSLQTAASTLQTALNGANNATSLLQLAAGGLSNVGNILQRLQSLATQANSGGDSSTLGFLNQEYQALLQQVDQISNGTTFNTTNLLNGSLSGAVSQTTNQNLAAGTGLGAAQTLFVVGASTFPTDGQTITIGGATITFTSDATKQNQVYLGSSPTATTVGDNLAAFLNSSSDSRLNQYLYADSAGTVTVQFRGGAVAAANNNITITAAGGTYNTTVASDATFNTATTQAGGENALGLIRTIGVGTINDANFTPIGQTTGLGTSTLKNNPNFVGNVVANNPVTATYLTGSAAAFTLKVGDFTYSTGSFTTSGAGTMTFTGIDSKGNAGGSFTLHLATGVTIANQAQANSFASEVTNALSGITFMQNQTINSYVAGGSIVTNGVTTGSLAGTAFNITSSNLHNSIGNIQVSSPSNGSSDAKISMTVNGETYTSQSGIGSTIAAGAYTVLTNQSNPAESIGFLNGATALNLTTAANAASAQAALQNAFGLTNGGSGLVFQVGTQASQTINVTLASSSSSSLGLAGTDISTVQDAVAASSAVAAAISTNSAQQANVGAQESRFNYVIANLTSSIQNTQAAASNYLSTDVSQASTNYASNQVKVLAGISVLAQVNQLPQNLLKLLA